MKTVLTIGGSNSKKSITKQLAEYIGSLVDEVQVINIDLNDYELPLYSVDIESEVGIPDEAHILNEIFDKADGFVVTLAEHNGSYSVAFKNVYDWLSRIENQVWRNKPMILTSSSPGERGGSTMLDIAKGRFPYMGATIVGSLAFPNFYDNFNDGKVINSDLNSEIKNMVEVFQKEI
ncbi:NADPH-dependent FMN reductase [Urechidicola croceus]|uniref:NADPH-dependent FMN reductase n=1 Tax=Urechidicola croceus TaxID=1850246 RepID=A0A1D8P6N0_9FLAO|nr:NAD(P)H-dependent oxidoreductase [Urechidicola croceus]AOW20226.1 NADPH-dependent FMN reductase [Urechidicola croceus]